MDLKQYFRKIREVEANIAEPQTFVVSLETGDGGKGGVITEVRREIAAKMIVEGRAALASESEKEAFLTMQTAARSAALKAEAARRLQVTIVSDAESAVPTVRVNDSGKPVAKR